MKGSKFTVEQMVSAVQEMDAGADRTEICRKLGIHKATLYAWKQKYGGMAVSEAKRLKQLEDENRKLKQLVAEQALDLQAVKLLLSKKW